MNVLSLSPSARSFQLLKSVGKAPGWRGVSGGEVAWEGEWLWGVLSVVVEALLVVALEGGSVEVGGGVEPPLGGLVELAKEIDACLLVLVFVLFFM